MICGQCRAVIPKHAWQPHNVSGNLSISYRCPNGHHGQINRVDFIIPPEGKPPETIPLAWAPVDFSEI